MENNITTVKTICRSCHGGCGVIVHMKQDKIVSLTGDKSNPNNRGFLCSKGKSAIEIPYHPDRLTHPLKRVGPKGSGQYIKINWSDAFELITSNIKKNRKDFGAESIVLCQGTDRNFQEWVFRLANCLGTPNVLGPAHVCFYPQIMASILTAGDFTFCDYENNPECIIIWGSNLSECSRDGVISIRLLDALKRGAKLIVIDPRRTPLVDKAVLWLRIKPGTDAALALGFIHYVIKNHLYDREFIEKHCSGFEQLSSHIERFDLHTISKIVGLPVELITQAAGLYARAGSAAIQTGNGITQNKNSLGCARAITTLAGICGNIDKPGGDVIWEPTKIVGRRKFPLTEVLSAEQREKRLGGSKYKILSMSGWAHPDAVWEAILDGNPYQVKSFLAFGGNPLLAYADSEKAYNALCNVKFMVVADLFPTPVAELADIILPVSSWLERNQVVEHSSYIAARKQVIQVGECKSDEEIINEIANRLNLSSYFWESIEESLDEKLKPISHSWKTLCDIQYIPNELKYFKYKSAGFRTRSGLFNLYSEALKHLGYDPLPEYKPLNDSTVLRNSYYLLTCRHSPHYFNSEFINLSSLRKLENDPTVNIHPTNAQRENIEEGEWVIVKIQDKSAIFKAKLDNTIDPMVVSVSAMWWYPEMSHSRKWRESNMNMLTNGLDSSEEMGTPNLRGIYCQIAKYNRSELIQNENGYSQIS